VSIRCSSWSVPPAVQRSRHGVPNGVGLTQLWTISPKPMSLPPIPTVTSWVPGPSASYCGGLTPFEVCCGAARSRVCAPLQLTSVSWAPERSATRCG
jgi:hypothetical protein